MPGEMMLRVANVGDETAIESVRDALDVLGVDYAMQKLSEEHGFDAELL